MLTDDEDGQLMPGYPLCTVPPVRKVGETSHVDAIRLPCNTQDDSLWISAAWWVRSLISAPFPWVAVHHLGDAEAEAEQALDSGLFDPLGLPVVMSGFLGCCILCRSRERGRPSACGMSASSSSGLAAESRVSGYHLNGAKDDVRSRPKVPRRLDVW